MAGKRDLVQYLRERNTKDLNKETAEEVVNLVLNAILEISMSGHPVRISNFGTFRVQERSATTRRNPNTGETVEIGPRRVLSFKPSPSLREDLRE